MLQVAVYIFTGASTAGFIMALLILVDGLRNYVEVKDDPQLRLTSTLWVAIGLVAAIAQFKLVILGWLIVGTPVRLSLTASIVLPVYVVASVAVLSLSVWVYQKRLAMRGLLSDRRRLQDAQRDSASVILDKGSLKIITWSSEATELLGWGSEVVDRDMVAWFIPVAWSPFDDWLLVRKTVTDSDQSFLAVARTGDGSELPILASVFSDTMAARSVYVIYLRSRATPGIDFGNQ